MSRKTRLLWQGAQRSVLLTFWQWGCNRDISLYARHHLLCQFMKINLKFKNSSFMVATWIWIDDFNGEAYSLMRKKPELSIFKNCISEMFRKQLYFFTCILPDYVFHESSKEFWKNTRFENMRASFLRRCQNSLWQTSHEMMHFQVW